MAKAGLCTIADKGCSAIEMIDMAAAAGAQGIEVWAQPDQIYYPLDQAQLSEIRRYAASKSVAIVAVGSYLGREDRMAEVPLTVEGELDLAEALGARLLRVWPGRRNYEQLSEAERSELMGTIRRWGQAAAERGVTIVLERHNGTLLNRWEGTREILDRIGHEAVCLNYQVVDPATPAEWRTRSVADYRDLLPVSAHAHLQNYAWDEAAGKRVRTYLDAGLVDYSELGDAARAAGYEGWFMVEFLADLREGLDEVRALRKDIDFIRGL
jgi:sugar phosphate isomerase/epimerase